MTIEEAIEYNKNLRMYMKISDKNQPCKFLEENYIALDMAIKSLEAWGKVKKELDETISACESNTMRSAWCDGELAGFLQSKDITDRNLSEV